MSLAFGKFLYQTGNMSLLAMLNSLSAYGMHKIFRKSLAWLHRKIFYAYFYRFPKKKLDALVDQFLNEHLENSYYPPVADALSNARGQGAILAIASSSPDFLVAPIAMRLGIEYWIGTCYRIDKQERLCEIGSVVDGEFKAEYLKKLMNRFQVSQDNVSAYSDSILDLPLLELAGSKFGVKPDRCLHSHCIQESWKIL